jgi:hypothetical protein
MEYKKENKVKQFYIFLFLIVLLGIATVVNLYFLHNQRKNYSRELDILCPGEIKTCSDGSTVNRIAPDCKFATCPTSFVNNETANWQTYKNDKYGFEFKNGEIVFEFKYPSMIKVIKDIPGYYEMQTKTLEVVQDRSGPGPDMNPDYYRIDYFLSFDDISGIKISPHTSDSQPSYSSKDFTEAVKLIVGDKQAVQRVIQSEKNLRINTYVFVDSITFDIGYTGENKPEFISLYNQILSTFKFTK